MSVTTTINLGAADKQFKCEVCGALVDIVVRLASRRRACIDCLPAREQLVFRSPQELDDADKDIDQEG